MAEWNEQAIILKLGHFREADLWLRALLRQRGLVTLFAFGGAKSRRRFSGCLDQFNTLDCQIRTSRTGEYATLAEAGLLGAPQRLRLDWRRMGLAANCLRFVDAIGIGPETARESFELLENLRATLEKPAEPSPWLPVFFRLRLAAILGFGPEFKQCSLCGRQLRGPAWFRPAEGQTLCAACSLTNPDKNRGPGIRLPAASLDLLDSVRQSLPCDWSSKSIADADLRQAARAIDGLVQFHLGLEWDNGKFRRI